jgi:predicted RNA-binding Zn-ribbon protein involved in translation (DUF1610 family)
MENENAPLFGKAKREAIRQMINRELGTSVAWIRTESLHSDDMEFMCPKCKGREKRKMPYCPNCGNKMVIN